jgi:hypothetical protein
MPHTLTEKYPDDAAIRSERKRIADDANIAEQRDEPTFAGRKWNLPSKTFFLFTIAAISLFLTILGNVLNLLERVTWEQFLDFLLVAVAQLTLNGFDVISNNFGPGNSWIRSGRFAALLFVVIAAGTLLNAIFHITSSARLFFTNRSNHDLVIGLGWHGQELLSKPSNRGAYKPSLWQRIRWASDTIAIDPKPDELARKICKTKGIPLLETDALSKDVPDLVGLHKLNRIFIAAGSDEVNIEIAFMLASKLVKKDTDKRIVVAVNLQVRKSFETLRSLIGEDPKIDLHMFSNTVSTAQALFSDKRYRIDRFDESRPKAAHLVVIGDDMMAVELLRSSLQYSIFEKDASLTVDVLCPRAQDFSRRWSSEYTCYAAVSNAELLPTDVYVLMPQQVWLDEKVLPAIHFHELPESARGQIDWCDKYVNPAERVTTVIVAMRNPSDSTEITESVGAGLANLAQRAKNVTEIWVYCNNRNKELRNSLASKLEKKYPNLHPKVFFDYLGQFSPEIASGEDIDEVAKRVNAMWAIEDEHIKSGRYKDRVTPERVDDSWNKKNANDKDSSRQSAVHACIKVRVKQRLSSEIDVQKALGEIEHRRWCAEYLLKGYVSLVSVSADGTLAVDEIRKIFDWYGGKKEAFKGQRLHLCLVPYIDLVTLLGKTRGEEEQNKDHRIVALLEWVLEGTESALATSIKLLRRPEQKQTTEADIAQVSSVYDFVDVVKLPIPVMVEFSNEDGTIKTSEGQVRYLRGDAILYGIKGEHWPVQRLEFLANYQPTPPTQSGQNGAYVKRASKTLAKKMNQPFIVTVGYADDPLQGLAGDYWLLHYSDNSQGVVDSDIFEKTYQVFPTNGTLQLN